MIQKCIFVASLSLVVLTVVSCTSGDNSVVRDQMVTFYNEIYRQFHEPDNTRSIHEILKGVDIHPPVNLRLASKHPWNNRDCFLLFENLTKNEFNYKTPLLIRGTKDSQHFDNLVYVLFSSGDVITYEFTDDELKSFLKISSPVESRYFLEEQWDD